MLVQANESIVEIVRIARESFPGKSRQRTRPWRFSFGPITKPDLRFLAFRKQDARGYERSLQHGACTFSNSKLR